MSEILKHTLKHFLSKKKLLCKLREIKTGAPEWHTRLSV